MRQSSRVIVITTVLGLLVHCATFAAAEVTTRRSQATELRARPASSAALALPVKRLPDLVKPNRVAYPFFAARPAPARFSARTGEHDPPRAGYTTQRHARSHALRIRLRPPDDPPQTIVLT